MKDLATMTRDEVAAEFEAVIDRERANGLVDVKFCASQDMPTEDAMRQFLYIQQMEAQDRTSEYSDY